MAYQPNIPRATDQLSQSQADIEGNFQAIQQLIDINHVDFSDGINYGKHNFVSFVQQGSDPTTSSTEVAMYSKVVGGIVTLFVRPASNGTPQPFNFPITTQNITITGTGSTATMNMMTLPNGKLLCWGKSSAGPLIQGAWNVVTFATPLPNTPSTIQLTPVVLNGIIVTPPPSVILTTGAILNSGFQIYVYKANGPGTNLDFSFFLIS